ncbi:hypothetical protein BSY19_4841 (plasmid) [Bosea sp. RAC05]|nr:hypothetical protein BSY19_4841 [Bosea sp. RAC05]
MRVLASFVVLLVAASAVAAQGIYCLPKNGKDRIVRVGTCPTGYFASGECCEAFRSESRRAFPKQGSTCPSGSFASASYCVEFR